MKTLSSRFRDIFVLPKTSICEYSLLNHLSIVAAIFGSFYVSSTSQFRAFYESAETGRPHARCRCFVREDQTDGRAKEEGHHGKREIFQTQVRRVFV